MSVLRIPTPTISIFYAEKELSGRCKGRDCLEYFAFKSMLSECGVNGSGQFGGSAVPAPYETVSSHTAPADVRHCFFPGHADVAVTYKQSICGGQVRCASEGKSVQGRGGFMPWHCHGMVASRGDRNAPT